MSSFSSLQAGCSPDAAVERCGWGPARSTMELSTRVRSPKTILYREAVRTLPWGDGGPAGSVQRVADTWRQGGSRQRRGGRESGLEDN
jgi:hypothetical protein